MADTLQNKFGGVNERVLTTDSIDFSSLNGVWPRSAGIQSRIEGKGLLAKYSDPIWSIYQFWTPFGYAVALLQFSTKLSLDQWEKSKWSIKTTISGKIDTGGKLKIDDGGTDIGTGIDQIFIKDTNTITGLHGGQECRFVTVHNDYSIASLIYTIEIASNSYDNEISNSFAPPYPDPLVRVPLANFAAEGAYTDTIPANFVAIRNRSSARFFSPGPYPHDFTVSEHQFSDVTNRRGILNLSFLADVIRPKVTLIGSDMKEYPLDVVFDVNNQALIPVDPSTYLQNSDVVTNINAGYSQGTTLIFATLRVYSLAKVCQPIL